MTEQEKNRLQNFFHAVQQYVGRDLSTPEALVLATIFPSLQSRSPGSQNGAGDIVGQARERAEQALESERQRVAETIKQTLGSLVAAPGGPASAQESGALALLNKATSLQQLQQAGQAAFPGKRTDAPPIVQIGERLMELVKEEVDRCFQEQFGKLNQQMAETLQRLNQWMAEQPQPATQDGVPTTAQATPATTASEAATSEAQASAPAATPPATASAATTPVAVTSATATAATATAAAATSPSAMSSAATSPVVTPPVVTPPGVTPTVIPPDPPLPDPSVPDPSLPEPPQPASSTPDAPPPEPPENTAAPDAGEATAAPATMPDSAPEPEATAPD